MREWQDSAGAPRDGSAFIGRFQRKDGQSLAEQRVTLAAWSEHEDGWVAAQWSQQADEGSLLCTNFGPGILTGWQPLPDLNDLDGWKGGAFLEALGGVFLADVGYPWPVLATWCDVQQQFGYAELQASWCQGKQDVYFEQCWHEGGGVERWGMLPAPAVGGAGW